MQSPKPAPKVAKAPRDYRLDFFRGLALFCIFMDHIAGNPFRYVTVGRFALADAAEVFIFISGYTAALVYGGKMLQDGALFATALIWRRAWQLYVAHLCLFLIYSAEVATTVLHFNNPIFADELGIGDFLNHPDETLLRVLTLRFQPTMLDILPLYISLLLVFPLFMLAMRRQILWALIPSLLIYLLAQVTGINLPGNDDEDGWYFNPFAWQLLFVIGACLGYARAGGVVLVPMRWRGRLLQGAAIVALAALLLQMSWTLHELVPRFPGILLRTLWPLDKSTLNPLRIISILALAVLVGRFVRRDAPFLTGRVGWLVVLCGQHSLNVFGLSILLSLLANAMLTFVDETFLGYVVVNVCGILIMIGLGLLCAWYTGGGKLPRRPGAADAAREVVRA